MVTILPFTFAPTHLHPTCVCTINAKSSAVAPTGSSIISPLGEKVKTVPLSISPVTPSIKSSVESDSF